MEQRWKRIYIFSIWMIVSLLCILLLIRIIIDFFVINSLLLITSSRVGSSLWLAPLSKSTPFNFLRRLLYSKDYYFQFIIRLLFSKSTILNLPDYYYFQKSTLLNLSLDYSLQRVRFSIYHKTTIFNRVLFSNFRLLLLLQNWKIENRTLWRE